MEFIRRSHLQNVRYQPRVFGDSGSETSKWLGQKAGTEVPDIDADRTAFDIIGFDLEAGDALIFSAWTLHGAPGNQSTDKPRMALSTRWLRDDVTWDPRPGTDPTVTDDMVCINPGDPITDNAFFPEIWSA
jgi:ectoine hydroxylase-related dioxygenase (phytanoyl-CoA dioxygenase family)